MANKDRRNQEALDSLERERAELQRSLDEYERTIKGLSESESANRRVASDRLKKAEQQRSIAARRAREAEPLESSAQELEAAAAEQTRLAAAAKVQQQNPRPERKAPKSNAPDHHRAEARRLRERAAADSRAGGQKRAAERAALDAAAEFERQAASFSDKERQAAGDRRAVEERARSLAVRIGGVVERINGIKNAKNRAAAFGPPSGPSHIVGRPGAFNHTVNAPHSSARQSSIGSRSAPISDTGLC